jgi:hypothetical protein
MSPGPSCPALAGGVQRPGGQIEAFQGRPLGGEMSLGPDGAPGAGRVLLASSTPAKQPPSNFLAYKLL